MAGSPSAVPAKTRLPDAKITSGLSVRGSTITSPRIPCALRISPTRAYSASDIPPPARLALCDRNRAWLALDSLSLLVAALENAGAPKERPYGVGRLRALIEPMVCSRFVDVERALTLPGSVLADDFDELAVARHLRIGDENAIKRRVFPSDATEANLYHWYFSLEGEK